MSSNSQYKLAVLRSNGDEHSAPHLANHSEKRWLKSLLREQFDGVDKLMRGDFVLIGEFIIWRVLLDAPKTDGIIEARDAQRKAARAPRTEWAEAN